MTSEEFEQKVAWIELLLKGKGAEVKWNEKIPDPDNPKQSRQIDVTIKRRRHLTIVECRLHSRPQNVTWIEELIGRRVSLNAYSAIAVSSSGFTAGAKKKANKHGIILRDFKSLTEEEVKKWGIAASVYLDYISFHDTILHLVIEPPIIYSAVFRHSIFQQADGNSWPLDRLFKPVASKLHELNRSSGSLRIQLFAKDLFCGGRQIEEIILQTNFIKKEIHLNLPVVYIYRKPGASEGDKVYIEGKEIGGFEIFRHKKSAVVIVDFSVVPPLERSLLTGIRFDFKKPVSMNGIKFIGQKLETFSVIPFKIATVNKDTLEHRSLLTNKDALIILPK